MSEDLADLDDIDPSPPARRERNVDGVASERLGIGRECPRCGARADTLGTICPVCRKPYVSGGLLDVLNRPAVLPLLALVGIVLVAGWIWLLVTHLVAGILAAAAAFGLLVAAIGVTNAAADRGR